MTPATPPRATTNAAESHDLYLDWLRGIAALLVFVTHVRSGYFAKWGDLDAASHGHINYVLFFLTRLGREAVVIFFVLSGYLVGGHAVVDYLKGRFSLARYTVARVSRLYVVAVPALSLTALFDYLHAWDAARDGIRSLLVNLLFLQGIAGDPYGSNGPFWSLSYEWWFYVLFGLGLAGAGAATRRSPPAGAFTLLLIAASVAVLWLKCPGILFMLPLWLFGVAARSLPTVRIPPWIALPCVSLALCVALGVSSLRWDWKGDLLVGVATTAFIYFFRGVAPLRHPWFAAGKSLAAWSFSLYALHYPLNSFVLSLFVPERLTHAGSANWLGWLLVVVGEATVCWAFYWLFERRTPLVRAWLLRLVRGTPPGQSLGHPAAARRLPL